MINECQEETMHYDHVLLRNIQVMQMKIVIGAKPPTGARAGNVSVCLSVYVRHA